MGRYCLATLMSSDRTKQICLWMTILIYIYILKFDHTNKWYMHNTESVVEIAMHKLLRDFEIQTDHLFFAKRPDLIKINKRKTRTC